MKINETKTSAINSDVSREQVKLGHLNHMGGVSYDINNPIMQLRVVASSCFFGEPMYYHEDKVENKKIREAVVPKKGNSKQDSYLDSVLGAQISLPKYRDYSPAKLIETVIDEALAFDPEATLQEAARLRNEEKIRTTPQVIMVRAANHEKVRSTGLIGKYYDQIMKRTDEAAVQLAYQVQVYGKPIPNSLKKVWKKFLETRTELDLAKYRMESHQFKTVDVVNLVRAFSPEIDQLVKGKLKLSTEDTWEALISKKGSSKETWEEAIGLMGHMALLRNLRNFHEKGVSPDLYLDKLVSTAAKGKQLPFRYFSAHNQLKESGVSGRVLDAVEQCLELSIGELPKFEGRVISLCDNSGSAQETMTSSMGKVRVADIANLTAVLTGKASHDGYIGVFGDNLEIIPVRKNASVFDQVEKANSVGASIGQGTENGIWLFFKDALAKKEKFDHIFVYSDMQAGHGGLYGTNPEEYKNFLWNNSNRMIDVAKLIKTYRQQVNPDVNVYLVQVAGYRDTLVPEFYDKTFILGGWGDGVLRFAHKMSHMDLPKPVENQEQDVKPTVVVTKKSRKKI